MDKIASALQGNSPEQRRAGFGITAGDYRSLIGLVQFMIKHCGLNQSMCHFMYGPLRADAELSQGEDTIVRVEQHTHLEQQLCNWRGQLLRHGGCVALSACAPVAPPASASRLRIRGDAALKGTSSPGLGGACLHWWWRFTLSGALLRMPIFWHETVANVVSRLVFRPEAREVEYVLSTADAAGVPSVLTGSAHADAVQIIERAASEIPELQ